MKTTFQERLPDTLEVDGDDVFIENGPRFFTAFRGDDITPEEQEGIDRLFEMMMIVKQQILLRRAHDHE